MANRPITIHSPCLTAPKLHVQVKDGDLVRWQADHAEFYQLDLPGGFFVGQPVDFKVLVAGEFWTDYYEVSGSPGSRISNYIHSIFGNCRLKTSDGPPDIIIDNTIPDSARKRAPKKKKKK